MSVDGKPFIRYNDFHLPLSEADVGVLEYMRQNPGKMRRLLPGGAGMNVHRATGSIVTLVGKLPEAHF
jgi:hypothetical protein